MPQSPNRCRVTALDHLVLTVRDLQATLQFYENALGMRASEFSATDGSRRWALTFGRTKINLHVAGQEFDPNVVNVVSQIKVSRPTHARQCRSVLSDRHRA